jgi:hypothetical protein
MREKKKKLKHAQLGNSIEFPLAGTLDVLPDANHLPLGSFDLGEDQVGAFGKFFQPRVRIVQEHPSGRASFVLGRELGMCGELSGDSIASG